jgi:hypothetical protein
LGFYDSIAISDAAAFTDPDLFGEMITRTTAQGVVTTFPASVDRQPPSDVRQAKKPAPSITVFLPYSSNPAKGVTSIDVGGDVYTIADVQGGTPGPHKIVQRIKQDAGGWLVEMR